MKRLSCPDRLRAGLCVLVLIAGCALVFGQGATTPTISIHQQQQWELTGREAGLPAQDQLSAPAASASGAQTLLAGTPAIDPNFIVFGYIQSESMLSGVRWNALTHVGPTFIPFDANGALTKTFSSRAAALKAGGAAQAAGVKVIMIVQNFDDSTGGAIEQVMTNATKRQTLITNIINAVTTDGYCQGVSFDLEMSWGTSVRDGIAAFLTALRQQLPSQYEISIYTNSIYSSSQWNVPNIAANCNYMIMSGYDWATGTRAHAITDHNSCVPQINAWINAGLPAEKFVYCLSSYGRRWPGATTYDGTGTDKVSMGFTNALWDTTLRTLNGGPFACNYTRGDEAAWYTYNDGTAQAVTWDNEESLEYKIRSVLSAQDTGLKNNGRRLRGIGFWSLYWFGNLTTSYHPIAKASGSYTRTYPHIYQLTEELLSAPGAKRFVFEKFEALNPRWTSFSAEGLSPDNSNLNAASTSRAIAATPSNGPANSTNAMKLTFSFSSAPGKCFFRHEVLKDNTQTAITDTNATLAHFDANTAVISNVYVPSAYLGLTVRMVVMDKNRNLEASPAYSLSSSGWRTLAWDLTSPATGNIYPLTTSEEVFTNGNGVIDTAGGGAKDISFIGFLVQRPSLSAPASGSIYFDELAYEHRNPQGKNYTINEFRYAGASGEFVEIAGPAGAFPANTELRVYNSSDGSVQASYALGGLTIPASGLFVVGDPNLPGLNVIPLNWTNTADNIPDTAPTALQIYNTATGCVYDSVVYRAMGGLKDLIRKQTHGVTGEGYGWCGEAGAGTDGAGLGYSLGRYPDGSDFNINEEDFSAMSMTPGAANCASSILGARYDFSSAPAKAFQSFQAFSVANPVSAGLPASPGGGNAHRCVDATGGGVVSVFGDASLGADGDGYTVTGEMYFPPSTAPVQANAVGFCCSQGSTFFATSVDGSGYDSGYWLIYENAAGAAIADGQADHPGAVQLVWATNDRMDASTTKLLASITLSNTLGVTPGNWATFRLTVDPKARNGYGLLAQVNGKDVYRGALPVGGPQSGSFQVGFRENHTGNPTAVEGTWVDSLSFGPVVPKLAPARDDTFTTGGLQPPGAPTGWSSFGMNTNNWAWPVYREANGDYVGAINTDPNRFRTAGVIANQTEWLPYSAIGPNNYVRVKYYMFGDNRTHNANTVPNMRLRAANRFAATSMLEVFGHSTDAGTQAQIEAEIRPSMDPANPSLYRVDFDPVDVPYLQSNANYEGVLRAFEAYSIQPQDTGYIGMTESVIGTYPAGSLSDAGAPLKVYAPSASDAGDLKVFNSLTDITIQALIPGTVEGGYASDDTSTTKPTYLESKSGITLDSSGVAADRIGILSREFDPDGGTLNYASRVRVEEGKQYKVRFHVTSNRMNNQQAQLRLRARTCKFSWTHKYEIGGAWATGANPYPLNANNAIAQQLLPGLNCQNPERMGNETNGGWYTMLFHGPMSSDIRPEFAAGTPLATRMPTLTAQPGPGQAQASARDLRVACDMVDSLSGNNARTWELGNFTIDRIEVRAYDLIPD